jgi:hypothetical protein
MNIDDAAPHAKHYLMVWIVSFRVLLGWNKEKTLAWAETWRDALVEEKPAHLLYRDGPVDIVRSVLVRLYQPGSMTEQTARLRNKLQAALTDGDERCDFRANWDLIAARERIQRILAECGQALPEPILAFKRGDPQSMIEKLPRSIPDWQMLLHASVADGAVRAIKNTLREGAQINEHGDSNWPPITWAIRHNRLESLSCLIEEGADLNHTLISGRARAFIPFPVRGKTFDRWGRWFR